VDAGQGAAIQFERLGVISVRQERFGQQTPVVDRIGFFERLPPAAQFTSGIEGADRRAAQVMRGARAKETRQNLDDHVGGHPQPWQEQQDVDPHERPSRLHDMDDADDLQERDQQIEHG